MIRGTIKLKDLETIKKLREEGGDSIFYVNRLFNKHAQIGESDVVQG
jgi:hypothetical protein